MRNKGLYIRLSQAEFDEVKAQGGSNRSAWIRDKLFPLMIGEFKATGVFTKPDNGTLITRDVTEPIQAHRCMKSHCNSMDAKLVVIQGMKAYLCKDHRLENPF